MNDDRQKRRSVDSNYIFRIQYNGELLYQRELLEFEQLKAQACGNPKHEYYVKKIFLLAANDSNHDDWRTGFGPAARQHLFQ